MAVAVLNITRLGTRCHPDSFIHYSLEETSNITGLQSNENEHENVEKRKEQLSRDISSFDQRADLHSAPFLS